jgi:hypothetical protein
VTGMQFLATRGLALVLGLAVAPSALGSAEGDSLRTHHAGMTSQLANSAFHQPLVLESTQTSGDLKGDVYAVVDHEFGKLQAALQHVEVWCDVLILHLNVKHCRSTGKGASGNIGLAIGKKGDQDVSDAYQANFVYQLAAAMPDFLKVQLSAKEGPLGTSNYRILFEATPLDATHSFVHMSYAYGYGFTARIAMQGYLATVGRNKVGFTVVGKKADGQPVYVDNVRGVVERNTMRYYLAIDTYLASLSLPAAQREEKRMHDWFIATERYPRQLHELEEGEYMAMKRKEIARQRSS